MLRVCGLDFWIEGLGGRLHATWAISYNWAYSLTVFLRGVYCT